MCGPRHRPNNCGALPCAYALCMRTRRSRTASAIGRQCLGRYARHAHRRGEDAPLQGGEPATERKRGRPPGSETRGSGGARHTMHVSALSCVSVSRCNESPSSVLSRATTLLPGAPSWSNCSPAMPPLAPVAEIEWAAYLWHGASARIMAAATGASTDASWAAAVIARMASPSPRSAASRLGPLLMPLMTLCTTCGKSCRPCGDLIPPVGLNQSCLPHRSLGRVVMLPWGACCAPLGACGCDVPLASFSGACEGTGLGIPMCTVLARPFGRGRLASDA